MNKSILTFADIAVLTVTYCKDNRKPEEQITKTAQKEDEILKETITNKSMVNFSYSPTKGKLTESTLDGTDRLPDLTTDEKEVDFVKSYTTETNTPYSHLIPRQELKETYPFGSYGLNIGLRIGF